MTGHHAAFRRLEDALTTPEAVQRRDALKTEIIALFRAVDRDLSELAALKDDVKQLVQRWKALGNGSADPEPLPGHAEAPTRADHLNASSHVERGWSLISLGEYGAAEEALGRALELVPEDAQAEALLGWARMLQHRYAEARGDFQRVLAREPQNSLARVNLGYICLKEGRFGDAIDYLAKAIRLDNDRKATLYAHYYLGLLYYEREMYEDSAVFLRKAIVLGPNLVEAHHELGRALWFADDHEGAREAWRAGERANKFSPWGKRCAELLAHVDAGGAPPRSPSSHG